MSPSLRRRDFLNPAGVGTAGLFVSPMAFGSNTDPLFQSKNVFTAGLDGIRE